jgi:hypothetical protein
MKKLLFATLAVFIVLLCSTIALNAQDDAKKQEKYVINMRKAMVNLDSSWASPAKMRETSNQFERLANFKKDDWIPRYYHALCQVYLSWMTDAKEREALLTSAQISVKKADSLSANNSEIIALEGYMYQAMIMINPMVNGAIYAPKSAETLQKSMTLDPNNPRPHYLLGQNLWFTPPMWGGGPDKGRPHLDKAKTLFEAFKPASEFHPNWGEIGCNMILEGKLGGKE